MNEDDSAVLLGRKKGEKLFRFIGGFSEPTNDSFEQDCRMECSQETNLEVGGFEYIGSALVNDFRYRRGPDKIKTVFFKGKRIFGAAKAGDDIEEVKWFAMSAIEPSDIVNGHRGLLAMLQKKLAK
jgi:bifunctional NMN adenylyltransferase/nudix hydrolase